MGVKNEVAASGMVGCGACGAENRTDAKFCNSCGQVIYEPCGGCGQMVLLTQKFCVACGADLEQTLQARHDEYERLMTDSVEAARDYDFERAVGLLQRVSEVTDYRFQETAANATEAITKIEAMRERAESNAESALARVKVALEKGDHAAVVELLEGIPARLLSDDARKVLKRVKAYNSEITELDRGVRSAIAEKNWTLVGGLVDQLLTHNPDDQQYVKVAHQVAGKLVAAAKKQFGRGRYLAAVEQLSSIPSVSQTEEYEQLRRSYEDVEWLSLQFDDEPFVTPMLGRLSVRFAKEVPEDSEAKERVSEMAVALKQAPRAPRSPFPVWKSPNDSWLGGTVHFLGKPKTFDPTDQQPLISRPGRFHVAFGLALQGLGEARVTEHFGPTKGLFKSLAWRKQKSCWGVDVGTASLKAVCLSKEDESIEVIDSYFHEFTDPVCRSGFDGERHDSVIVAAVERFLDKTDIGDTPVWANVGSSEIVNRFVRLPPVSDKEASNLLDLEIDQRVPIDREDLAVVRRISKLNENNESLGRPANVSAAKKNVIEQRIELLRGAGLNVVGLQGDAIATVNFAAYEFADVIGPNESSDEDADQESDKSDRDHDENTPAIVIVDCGAANTNMVIVSAETHWVWTIDSAGEDLTTSLARATKSTHAQAEQLKRNPAEIVSPAKQYQLVEQRLEEVRMRLEKVFRDAMIQNSRFDVRETWCIGGGCIAHQWIRRMMLARK